MADEPELAIDRDLAKEAFHEALRRYPDAHGALVFLWTAAGLAESVPTAEHIQWAHAVISRTGAKQ